MNENTKTCKGCNLEKPVLDFYKLAAMKDGLTSKCKECTKKCVHEYRQGKGRDKVLAYDRIRSMRPERVAQRMEIFKRWKHSNPERRQAQVALNNALRDGRIQPQPCFICGEKGEAHHPDYSRPLDVSWLCRAHHMQAHAETKRLSQKILVNSIGG